MNKKIMRVYSEIDLETGECIESRELDKDEFKGKYLKKSRVLTSEQIRKLNSRDEMKWFNQELGGFVFIQYVKNELLFNELDLELPTLARIICLATYIDYEDRNSNVLMKRGLYNQLKPLTRTDLKYILNLKENAFINFMKEVKDKGLLKQNEDMEYVVNDKYFSKGKSNFSKKGYTRLYINTIRSLYENTRVTQHRTLGYVFKLLPKMHYETNQICHNPNSTNPIPMSFREVAEYVGYGVKTKQNISTFKKSLYNLTIEYDKRKFNLFKGVILDDISNKQTFFVVNPLIAYSGNEFDIMNSVIGKMFFQELNNETIIKK